MTLRNLAIVGVFVILIFIVKAKIQNASVEMKIPYVALNMVLETQIAITENEEYLENLEKKTGMSRKKIKKLFKYLSKNRFYLDYDNRKTYANIFKIEHIICIDEEWRHNKNISIFVLKRIYPNILRAALGYAPAWSSDVVVIKDLFTDVVKEYKTELENKKPRIQQGDANANRIRYELTYKDLNGISHKQIERSLIILTAIHESKHRIDEIEMPSMRLNLDLEVSAYLTAAIFGEYPFLELRKLIEWADAYYRSTGYTQLRYLLAELWALADNSLKQDYSKEHLKVEMRKIYENYRTIQEDANFIDLNEFEQRMLPRILCWQ